MIIPHPLSSTSIFEIYKGEGGKKANLFLSSAFFGCWVFMFGSTFLSEGHDSANGITVFGVFSVLQWVLRLNK